MLVSSRFTQTLTKATKNRLNKVLDNSKPMTRREKNRGAVVTIQSALSDLNQGYLSSSEVDGFFGRRMANALEAFQRDYGLFADGLVGRQTLTELDQIFSSDLFRTTQGFSIHVGVNFVDEDHYGDTFPLSACVNDANDFHDLANNQGYSNNITLTDKEATTANFTAAMRQAATNLFSGDSLFVTFSGHGSQLTNTSTNEEADLLDETLCFYDRMLIDDEIYALLAELRPGVNATLLYDSCHSATVTKMLLVDDDATSNTDNIRAMSRRITAYDPEIDDANPGEGSTDEKRFVPFARNVLDKALDGDDAPRLKHETISKDKLKGIADALDSFRKETNRAMPRFIPGFSAIYERNAELYDAIKDVVGQHEQEELECHVVALSACQDNQTTLDGLANGLYTGKVLSTWDNAGFVGSIQQLHKRLLSDSSAMITPALHTYGGPRAQSRLYERPFSL